MITGNSVRCVGLSVGALLEVSRAELQLHRRELATEPLWGKTLGKRCRTTEVRYTTRSGWMNGQLDGLILDNDWAEWLCQTLGMS